MQANQISRRPLSDHPEFPKLRTVEIFPVLDTHFGVDDLKEALLDPLGWGPIAFGFCSFWVWAFVGAILLDYGVLIGLPVAIAVFAAFAALWSCYKEDGRLRILWHKLMSPCLWKLQLCLERRDERPRKLPPVLFIHGKSVYQAVDVRKGWVSCLDKGQSLQHFPRSECFLPGPQDMNLLVEYEAEREAAGAAERQSMPHPSVSNADTWARVDTSS